MADSFITQCPHCQVKFKLTESQLNAAKGSVRCGACLNIFNAKEHLTANQAKPTPVKKVAPEPVKRGQISQPATSTEQIESNSDNLFEFDNDPTGDIEDDISESLFAGLDEQSGEFELPEDKDTGYSSDDDDINSFFAEAEEGLNNIFEEPESENSLDMSATSEADFEQISDDFSNLQSAESIFDESKIDTSSELSGLNDTSDDDSEDDFIFGVDEPNEFEIDDQFLNFDEKEADAFSGDAFIIKRRRDP